MEQMHQATANGYTVSAVFGLVAIFIVAVVGIPKLILDSYPSSEEIASERARLKQIAALESKALSEQKLSKEERTKATRLLFHAKASSAYNQHYRDSLIREASILLQPEQ